MLTKTNLNQFRKQALKTNNNKIKSRISDEVIEKTLEKVKEKGDYLLSKNFKEMGDFEALRKYKEGEKFMVFDFETTGKGEGDIKINDGREIKLPSREKNPKLYESLLKYYKNVDTSKSYGKCLGFPVQIGYSIVDKNGVSYIKQIFVKPVGDIDPMSSSTHGFYYRKGPGNGKYYTYLNNGDINKKTIQAKIVRNNDPVDPALVYEKHNDDFFFFNKGNQMWYRIDEKYMVEVKEPVLDIKAFAIKLKDLVEKNGCIAGFNSTNFDLPLLNKIFDYANVEVSKEIMTRGHLDVSNTLNNTYNTFLYNSIRRGKGIPQRAVDFINNRSPRGAKLINFYKDMIEGDMFNIGFVGNVQKGLAKMAHDATVDVEMTSKLMTTAFDTMYSLLKNKQAGELRSLNAFDSCDLENHFLSKIFKKQLGEDYFLAIKEFSRITNIKQLDDKFDWNNFKNYTNIVDKIINSIKKGEEIVVYGDNDGDGVISSAIFKKLFELVGHHEDKFQIIQCKNRKDPQTDTEIAEKIKKGNLIIFVDLGTNFIDSYKKLTSLGKSVIVIDHHNSTIEDSEIITSDLTLNGFLSNEEKLQQFSASALSERVAKDVAKGMGIKLSSKDLLHFETLFTLGTLSDIQPLDPKLALENFLRVKFNITALRQEGYKGISQVLDDKGGVPQFLKTIYGGMFAKDTKDITAGGISYQVLPIMKGLLKTGGDSKILINFINTTDEKESQRLWDIIKSSGARKKTVQDNAVASIIKKIDDENYIETNAKKIGAIGFIIDKDLYTYSKPKANFNKYIDAIKGVTGNVASKIVDYTGFSTIIGLRDKSGNLKISIRSNIPITESIKFLKEKYNIQKGGEDEQDGISGGGHEFVGGIEISSNRTVTEQNQIFNDLLKDIGLRSKEYINTQDYESQLKKAVRMDLSVLLVNRHIPAKIEKVIEPVGKSIGDIIFSDDINFMGFVSKGIKNKRSGVYIEKNGYIIPNNLVSCSLSPSLENSLTDEMKQKLTSGNFKTKITYTISPYDVYGGKSKVTITGIYGIN